MFFAAKEYTFLPLNSLGNCPSLLPQKKCWNPNGAVCLIVVVTYDENISKSDMKSRNDLEWNLKVLILECNIWSVATEGWKFILPGRQTWGGHCTMKPLKDELIQSRLDEDELADFDKVKKLLDVKRNTLKYKGR